MKFTEATDIIIVIFQKFMHFIFEVMDIGNGVTVGYIIAGVFLIGAIIATLAPRIIGPRNGEVQEEGYLNTETGQWHEGRTHSKW